MRRQVYSTLIAAAVVALAPSAYGADAAAGKAYADEHCADCHEPADWAGEDVAAVTTAIKDVVSGKAKHKTKLSLTDAQIADVAAFWAAGK